MRYPDPERTPRRVRAGTYDLRVVDSSIPEGVRVERRTSYIHTSRVQSHLLAHELRSRVHTHVDDEGAAES